MNMFNRTALAVSLPVALAAGIAQAQTPGQSFDGTGEMPRGVSTVTIPEGVPAIAPPMVADFGAVLDIGRGLVTEDTLRDVMGTATRFADGRDSTAPASDAVMRALMGDDAPAAVPGTQEDVELERSFGPDNIRKQVTDPEPYPVRAYGYLYMQWPVDEHGSRVTGNCTGALIGPATVLTAAHCVYIHDEGGWPEDIFFAPAMLDASTFPHGVWEWDEATILSGYISEYAGDATQLLHLDIAVVHLTESIGEQLGWLGYQATEEIDSFRGTLIGYGQDKPEGTLWESNCSVTLDIANATEDLFIHYCEAEPGSSGGGMFAFYPDTGYRMVHGTNVAGSRGGDDDFNIALRMNRHYVTFLNDLWR